MRFVLASASPARLAVLRSAGIDPSVIVSGVDEEAIADRLIDPSANVLVSTLAEAKANAVAETIASVHANAVVVGCDSMLAIDDSVVGKPGTTRLARERWASMAGGTGELLTGHTVIRIDNGERAGIATGTKNTTVRFGTPDTDELDAYLESGEPLSVAGGFTLDGLGGWFVEGIDGDPSSVIGISLPLTRRLLTEVGVRVTDLWR